jgi:hypothetical protein
MAGLRTLYAQTPDVILINALHFASEDYGFARVLAEEPRHEGVGVVVLVSGALEEIRSRAVQQFGATILELPANGDELAEAITKARGIRTRTSTPRPVAWGRVEDKPAEKTAQEESPPTVHRVSWQAFDSDAEETNENVRPVNWAVDGAGSEAPKPQAARPKAEEPHHEGRRNSRKRRMKNPNAFHGRMLVNFGPHSRHPEMDFARWPMSLPRRRRSRIKSRRMRATSRLNLLRSVDFRVSTQRM